MAMGRRKAVQEELFVPQSRLEGPRMRPFYARLNELLAQYGFDQEVEALCEAYYAPRIGRPSLPPGAYFRSLLLGYFEGIESERGIAWRLADSVTSRRFIGLAAGDLTPDHSTLCRIRQRLPLEVHAAVFAKVLEILSREKLLRGKTLGLDATLLAANASLTGIRQRVDAKSYRKYVAGLMAEDPEAPDDPTDDEIARYDRKRRGKRLSNRDWENPHNPDAKIARMKDGRTRFAEKCEHAVDLDTGAIVAVTVQPADRGDTHSLIPTLTAAAANLHPLKDRIAADQADQPGEVGAPPPRPLLAELVADKGYHSNDICTLLASSELATRSYISEPDRGRRRWTGKATEQAAVYANRRRIRGERGKRLMRRRGELLERPFAHYLDHGGMRRVHLRGHENIAKRLLIHVAGFNLGLVMRKRHSAATPRALADRMTKAQRENIASQNPCRRLLARLQRPHRFLQRTVTGLLATISRHFDRLIRQQESLSAAA